MQVASHSPVTPAESVAVGGHGPAWLRPAARYGEVALGVAAGLAMMAGIWAAFFYAPTDAVQGEVQRIEYFHVPMAWVAYLSFFIVFVASIIYLWRRDERWDLVARAGAELGTVFTTLVLITGSLWGKPIWGTWWAWDARMTTTLILWFIYVGYLVLRSYTGRSEGGARAAAVLGIIGFVDVPIDYLSVTWWRTLHPALQVPLGGQPQAPAAVISTLMLCLLAFTLLFAFLMIQVYRLQRLQTETQRLRALVEME